jgi:hypothetical protein
VSISALRLRGSNRIQLVMDGMAPSGGMAPPT